MDGAKIPIINGITKLEPAFKALPQAVESEIEGNGQETINLLEKVFIPDWNNKPIDSPPVVSINGESVLTEGNISSIIAQPGAGKTSVLECIAAYKVNPDCDSLGFEIRSDCKVLIADMERVNSDVWNSYYRISRRAGTSFGHDMCGFKIAGLRAITDYASKRKVIEELLSEDDYGLLVLDGIGSFVKDSNDPIESTDVYGWMIDITTPRNLSILTTLHPNPNSNKPRGHTGGMLGRDSESVMLLNSIGNGARIITTEFDYGKSRNNKQQDLSSFIWDDDLKMFVSVDIPAERISTNAAQFLSGRKKAHPDDFGRDTHIEVLKMVFRDDEFLTSSDFRSRLCEAWQSKDIGGETMGDTRAKEFKSFYCRVGLTYEKSKQAGNATHIFLSYEVRGEQLVK